MTVNADVINTKTFIEESGSDYTTSWSLGDQIAAFEVGNGVIADEKTVSSALTADSADASFTMDFSGNTTLSPDYSYIFVYPAVRYSVNDGKTKYRVLIPDEQTFSSTTFDKNADILISEPVSGQASRPTSVHVGFERIGATVLMNLKAPTTSETITSIVFSTTQDNIQGYVEITPASDTYTKTIYSGGKSITLTPASATTYTGTIPVWFRCAAIDLNTDFTVVVNTNARSYKKTVNLASASKEIKFENAGMTKFNVDMTSVDPFVSFDVGTVITSVFPTVNKGIKFTGSNTTYYRPYRVNKNNAITIDGGTATIKMIEFKFASGKEGDWSGDTGTVTDGVWTGSANTVVLTNTGNQSQFYDISVTYSGTGSNDVVVSTATSSLAATVPSIGVGNTTATTLTTNSPGAVTYSSNHPEYATVDPSTGVVTGVAAGTATITASIAAVDNGYIKVNASSATVDVTVTSDNVYTMTMRSASSGSSNVRWQQSDGSLSYGGITWTPSVSWASTETSWPGSATMVQIGAKNKQPTSVSLTTTGFAGKKIVSASLTGFCTNETGPTLSITAGSTTILSSEPLIKTTSTEYTSTNASPVTLTSGQAVTFTISSSSNSAICISQIKVVYQD